MLYLAWFSLVIYVLGVLIGAHKRISAGETFGQFTVTLLFQSCIIGCLVYLILLL